MTRGEVVQRSDVDLSDAALLRAVEGLLAAADECRRLFRARALARGVTPTWAEVDEAMWDALRTGRVCDVG
jgi:hypothetical protein